ncbi:MAG: hypothetical protein A49_32710 [Methyloceanibacter sp.]|nr:MAG: hypothetical protein A49_32710 [Methyloceanibacter sp.]
MRHSLAKPDSNDDTEAATGGTTTVLAVMPGLAPGIHVRLSSMEVVDGRVKPGHDNHEKISEAR